MRPITVLDQQTIDKIAAGEVIERPASVVKELVENAIDAGATAVTVEITEGGKKMIRITDNGSGIETGQVKTAFFSHATSKIEKAEDLEGISTLGFRGEALSSIAAISRVELITKTPLQISGTRYLIEGGREVLMEEVGAPDGSTFIVRDLFFNTPARKKFLKTDTSEAVEVSSLMEQLALSHPEIAFKYMQGNQVRLHTSGSGRTRDVIYHVFGKEVTRSLLEISYRNEFMTISGFAGKPEISRGNRAFENYYVNGRYVRSQLLSRGIEDAYKGFLMQHRFPFVLLDIRMDGDTVDVNVHPRKLEVRFSLSSEVYEGVREAVRGALTHTELIPRVQVGKEEKQKDPETSARHLEVKEIAGRRKDDAGMTDIPAFTARPSGTMEEAVPYMARIEPSEEPALSREEESLFEGTVAAGGISCADTPVRTSSSADTSVWEALEDKMASGEAPAADTSVVDGSAGGAAADALAEGTCAGVLAGETVAGTFAGGTYAAGTLAEGACAAGASAAWVSAADASAGESMRQQDLFEDRFLDPASRTKHRLIGQLFGTYWLVEYGDRFFIIDQHAAHEKIFYERLVEQFRQSSPSSQQLLPPLILSLTMEEEQKLLGSMELFEKVGFEIEHYGGKEYCVRAVPENLYGFGEKELFREILDQPLSSKGSDGIELFARKLATMACKAAVKGNHSMSREEADLLIDELLGLKEPYHCPHGRPTIIEMTKTDIEKKFHRIV